MQEKDNIYNCDDESLGAMLARLFSEGNKEVVVTHPVDGDVVVTKADYKKHLRNIEKAAQMSPADRVTHNAKIRNLKNQKQIRFRTALINAPVHVVDMDGENNFGKDVDGFQLDLEKMIFLPVAQYLKGIELKPNEVGCFFDQYNEKRGPIRITAE